MAIKTDTYILNGREFTRTYSDSGHYVVRDGVSYSEANDPSEFNRIYIEGDPIPIEEQEELTEILNIILGGES